MSNSVYRHSFLAFALVALLAAGTAVAQEQVGSIEGVVLDEAALPLPGVTIEATGPLGQLTAVTDLEGRFRFPAMQSGYYKLKATLSGFATVETDRIEVVLGKTIKVNVTMRTGQFEEAITVAADQVRIDVTKTQTATSISREEIALLPRGRDFTAVVTQAAGAVNDQFAAGISVDGASGSENRFIIDGIDTTNPHDGLSGQSMMTEFIEEVQVKSAGYSAEHGGALGGVINAITKTGGNDFAGSVGVYYRNEDLLGDQRPTVYRDAATGLWSTRVYDKDKDTRFEPSLSLGGPILRDKLWFFVAYQPAFRSVERVNVWNGEKYEADRDDMFLTANIKGNIGSKFLYKVAANLSPYEEGNELPDRTFAPAETADFDVTSEYVSESYSAYGDFLLSDSFLINGRLGYFKWGQDDSGYPHTPDFLYHYVTGAVYNQLPAAIQHPQGYTTNPSNWMVTKDQWERQQASVDASYFLKAAGSHSFKAGVQFEEITNDVIDGQIDNQYIVRYGVGDRFGMGVQGTYGAVEVRRFETLGAVTSENLGLFIQDSWAITRNLTINLGVRTEQEKIPNYQKQYGEYAIKFDFEDKIAPRIGFAWDITGEQKWKVFGSYGTYYDIMKLALARGSFGGDRWLSHFYAIEDPDWRNWQCDPITNQTSQGAGAGPCSGIGEYGGFLDVRHVSTTTNGGIDPSIKPMQQREWQVGLDHQLTNDILVGLRYVNKDLVRTIEDIGFFYPLPDGGYAESFIIGNPGEGITGQHTEELPTQPKARREYQALELSFAKRYVNNWMVNATYTYSKLYGNYAGLASSDEITLVNETGVGRHDPNVQRYYDSLHNAFNAQGEPVYGRLATDRPHQFKMQALYTFPFRLSVGLNQYVGSGTPVSSEINYGGVPFFAWGRGDQGRTPTLTQTDLMLTQPFKVGGLDFEASINVLNLFDEDTVIRYSTTKYANSFFRVNPNCFSDQECFFNQTPFDPDEVAAREGNPRHWSYMKPSYWQAARQIRLGLKMSF